ncbi:cytochrome B [Maribrevibacterium harenarium]|uniref:Cytochrome B n=1 Tax=Maribrevibacterium harenarium TaxID=2589817 RepID=A0A501WG89_9GAMM|nr:cytochrome b/b6 domain-containing protein [Maribrevibacterium harenarium]TPE44566.1 cytochrome B [Maribrevibacterium harenarium]
MSVAEQIWDPIIRLFHWSVAVAFLLNFFVLERGESPHEWAGYYILIALVVRLFWGFVGPDNVRFVSFLPSWSKLKAYLSELLNDRVPEEDGHNPLGALMIFALLFGLLTTGLSGWGMEQLDEYERALKGLHELAANTTFMLVMVHAIAVVVFSFKGPRNLVRQMITGRVAKH